MEILGIAKLHTTREWSRVTALMDWTLSCGLRVEKCRPKPALIATVASIATAKLTICLGNELLKLATSTATYKG